MLSGTTLFTLFTNPIYDPIYDHEMRKNFPTITTYFEYFNS